MKKTLTLACTIALGFAALTGCSDNSSQSQQPSSDSSSSSMSQSSDSQSNSTADQSSTDQGSNS